VILDVVYNHAFSTVAWEAMAPGHWFRKDHHGHFKNHSGCGNDFETTRPLFRRMMTESLLWMVKAYDFDGFRFDLMGLIDRETMLAAQAACQALKPDILFLGEGWRMYDGPSGTLGMDQTAVAEECPIAMFSDEFRDLVKGGGLDEKIKAFLHGSDPDAEFMPGVLRGAPEQRFTALHPWNNVNYLECHDGLTAHDNLAFNLKLDPRRPEHKRELLERLAIGHFLQAFSQGICFLHAGQEFGRSKTLELPLLSPDAHALAELHEAMGGFVRNSYRSGDAVNAWAWHPDPDRLCLRSWTATLLEIRRSHDLFWSLDADELKETFHWYPLEGPALAWSLETAEQVVLMACNTGRTALRPDLPEALFAELAAVGGFSRQLGKISYDSPSHFSEVVVDRQTGTFELAPLGTIFLAWSRSGA
jgi:pullulanase/glycogen debranching enzyme